MNIFLVMNYGAINIENIPNDFKLEKISLTKLGSKLLSRKTGIPEEEFELKYFKINATEKDFQDSPVRVHTPFNFKLIKK